MLNRLSLCVALLVSACAVDPAAQDDVDQQLTAGEDHARPSGPDPAACKLAAGYEDGKLAEQSCVAGTPINAAGVLALSPSGPASTQACATYTGSCTGGNGCSRANGGGWSFTACGTFLYAWMTICDGQPSGWGTGFCLF